MIDETEVLKRWARLMPAADRADCIEYGTAIDNTGQIEAFDEPVIPAEPVRAGDKVALVLTRIPGTRLRLWYAVRC